MQEERRMRFHRTKLTASVSLPRASIVATDTMMESKPTKSRERLKHSANVTSGGVRYRLGCPLACTRNREVDEVLAMVLTHNNPVTETVSSLSHHYVGVGQALAHLSILSQFACFLLVHVVCALPPFSVHLFHFSSVLTFFFTGF